MRMLKVARKPVDPKAKGVEEGELGLGVFEAEICRARAPPAAGVGRRGGGVVPLPPLPPPLPVDPKAGHRYRVFAAAGG